MLTDVQLFECFNVELPNGAGNLWQVKKIKGAEAAKKVKIVAGEAGSKERIELYRQRVEQYSADEKSIFED